MTGIKKRQQFPVNGLARDVGGRCRWNRLIAGEWWVVFEGIGRRVGVRAVITMHCEARERDRTCWDRLRGVRWGSGLRAPEAVGRGFG